MNDVATLILSPGLLLTRKLYASLEDHLAGRYPVHHTDTTGLDTITAMAERVIDETDGPIIPIGLSMGGYITLEIARLAPERLSALIIMDSNATADTEAKREERQKLIAMSNIGRFKGVTSVLMPKFIAEQHLNDARITDAVTEMAAEIGRDNFILQQKAIMTRREQFSTLSGLSMPGLFLVGSLDLLTPPDQVRAMADAMAGSTYVEIEGSGHLPPLEAPAAVNLEVEKFLSGL
ncbi:alpha/beta fold hydrolase [Alphaproteobacteria bacterium LSUCC0684]